jgi:hypothetical protein
MKCGKLDVNSVSFKQVQILGQKKRERETREDVKSITV